MSEPVAQPSENQSLVSKSVMSSVSQETGMNVDDLMLNHLSYKASNGQPYIIDYFGINEFYENNKEVTAMARELHELLVNQDSETLVAQTKDALDFLTQELNLKDNDAGVYKLKQALTLARIRQRQNELEGKKLQALADSLKV